MEFWLLKDTRFQLWSFTSFVVHKQNLASVPEYQFPRSANYLATPVLKPRRIISISNSTWRWPLATSYRSNQFFTTKPGMLGYTRYSPALLLILWKIKKCACNWLFIRPRVIQYVHRGNSIHCVYKQHRGKPVHFVHCFHSFHRICTRTAPNNAIINPG